jgi:hypothetical protein
VLGVIDEDSESRRGLTVWVVTLQTDLIGYRFAALRRFVNGILEVPGEMCAHVTCEQARSVGHALGKRVPGGRLLVAFDAVHCAVR